LAKSWGAGQAHEERFGGLHGEGAPEMDGAEVVARLQADPVESLNSLGNALTHLGRHEEAEAALRLAMQRNPAAPGMKYATLLALINKGHVSARSIIRGPTTHQMWRYAAHVRGVSREFGLCFSCGGAMDRGNSICPHCQRSQDAPPERARSANRGIGMARRLPTRPHVS